MNDIPPACRVVLSRSAGRGSGAPSPRRSQRPSMRSRARPSRRSPPATAG
ncbi:hypothetical protein ACFQZ4_09340 [Catellatospora coxensis]